MNTYKLHDDGTVETLDEAHTNNLLTRKLEAIGLTEKEIRAVLIAIETTCKYCWDGKSNCPCRNIVMDK